MRGKGGSGRIRSLPTYGLFNLVPARLCVGVSLRIINNIYEIEVMEYSH